MGDVSNMADIDRFLRSEAGAAYLDEIVAMLKGHTITDVTFSNEVRSVATTLHFDDGSTFVVFQASLDVDVLREEFRGVLKREYYKDYPERRPKRRKP